MWIHLVVREGASLLSECVTAFPDRQLAVLSRTVRVLKWLSAEKKRVLNISNTSLFTVFKERPVTFLREMWIKAVRRMMKGNVALMK